MYRTALGQPCDEEPGSQVEYHFMPKWLGSQLCKVAGRKKCKGEEYLLLWNVVYGLGTSLLWFDHWGTAIVNGHVAFVAEPYLRVDDDLSEAREFAELMECNLSVEKKSCWFPGKTIRLVFIPKGGARVQSFCSLESLRPSAI